MSCSDEPTFLQCRSAGYLALKNKFDEVELLLSELETKSAGMSGEGTSREYSYKVGFSNHYFFIH